MTLKIVYILNFLLLFVLTVPQSAFPADFTDWEKAGEVLNRFGEGHSLKSPREWIQSAQEHLLTDYYRSKNLTSPEAIRQAARSDREKGEKEESRSYSYLKIPLDRWKGYHYLSLTYTNLDFREQAFGIHYELVPGTLDISRVLQRYGTKEMEIIDEGKEKRYRFSLPFGNSLNGTPLGELQAGMIENDELWVDFYLRDEKDVRFVEVLTVKSDPYRTPFTKNWKWDD